MEDWTKRDGSMIDVVLYTIDHRQRSKNIADGMAVGVRMAGDKATIVSESQYRGSDAGVAVFYGLEGNLPKVWKDFRDTGRTVVFFDLGYWWRKRGERFKGYHKISVNSRNPTAHFQSRNHDDSRFRVFDIGIKPWKKNGHHILLAGMSRKSAESIGLKAEQWERWAVSEIRKVTDRPIVYRPKPSWAEARPMQGTTFSPRSQTLEDVLKSCHAVVTHHSNVSVDGQVLGIPSFCWDGVAVPMSLQDISKINDPLRRDDRHQWLCDVAWVQFNVAEMASGMVWRHLKDEGLVA